MIIISPCSLLSKLTIIIITGGHVNIPVPRSPFPTEATDIGKGEAASSAFPKGQRRVSR